MEQNLAYNVAEGRGASERKKTCVLFQEKFEMSKNVGERLDEGRNLGRKLKIV